MKKKIKPAAIVATGSVSLLAMLGIYFGIIGGVDVAEKRIPKDCTKCESGWIAVAPNVSKKILRYKMKKNEQGAKTCHVWGSDHVWYELSKVECEEIE